MYYIVCLCVLCCYRTELHLDATETISTNTSWGNKKLLGLIELLLHVAPSVKEEWMSNIEVLDRDTFTYFGQNSGFNAEWLHFRVENEKMLKKSVPRTSLSITRSTALLSGFSLLFLRSGTPDSMGQGSAFLSEQCVCIGGVVGQLWD